MNVSGAVTLNTTLSVSGLSTFLIPLIRLGTNCQLLLAQLQGEIIEGIIRGIIAAQELMRVVVEGTVEDASEEV